ncbi:short-chain dehydrogenase [Labrys miyagiensis]|uniref:Short-chain dehydrogenase n=1 Tax=Labrys miyagiensis TaxID=346912 RepID=A0ABQ6CPL0_9HYPH|nr:SDR family oxidoreductase [Labrys miyagiensis]GLS22263.1 short-chain dehydrogenase [Labrys miyagiensis]
MSSQHVVIIGGSSGIGLATARQLLGSGMQVTIIGRSEHRLAEARQSLGGGTCVVLDAAATDKLAETFSRIGGFDHLVLAFGSGKGLGPFASISLSEVREGFEEKVYPQFAAAQAALPFLPKDGSITFISSVSAHAAMPGTAGISAANAAVASLVPILAAELRPLRVNSVSPGVIDTPWWDFLPPEQRKGVFAEYAGKTPVGRVGKPEDVAQAITFVIKNGFMSGHNILCDGGLRWAS